MKLITTIIAFLYADTGIITIIGYIPTIKDLLRRKESANIHSYTVWTLTGTISFLYALLVASDLLLEIVIGLNLVFCTIILILSLRLKNGK